MEFLLQLLPSLCLVGVCSLVLYLYYVVWLQPESIRRKLRRQGITGPPPRPLYGNSLEMKRLVAAARSRAGGGGRVGGEIKHDYTPLVFPYFEQWRKDYGISSSLELMV